QTEGELKLAGLKEPVEVLRDRWGIAHIYAKNQHDLFFAQGFVAAQDRLFQIDLWRRQATGEMAEVFGPDYVEADKFARLVKYRGKMEDEWTSYAPDTKEIAIAFTDGINAAIDQFGDKLPIEFQILGFKPKKWKPEDVLGRMSGIIMSQNFRNEIQRARLVVAVGIEKARWLAPVDPAREYVTDLNADELKAIDGRILKGYEAATKALSFTPAKTESNNWVVSGERSTSGKPLLASDPHRATALPSLRYLVHLNAPGWNVIGSGEPGLPGVAIGHNDKIAWGFTIIGVDQADIHVGEVNPENPAEYEFGAGWQKMTIVKETIRVKGEKPREVELRFADHGPVLFLDEKRHRAYSLNWVGNEPGGAAYLASLSVDRAKNKDEFLTAIRRWEVPGLNFVYADVEGNIGWIAAASTPIRRGYDGLFPIREPGPFSKWSGYLAVKDLPQDWNPKAGWLATANHKILPEGYKHQIGYEFAAPYRFHRVRDRLASKEKWTLEDFRAIQHDDTSIPGLALAKLLKSVELNDKNLEPYAKLLTEWDGRLTVDAKAGPLYAIWLRELQQGFYSPHAPKELVASLISLGGLPNMLAVLERPDAKWFGNNPKAGRDKLLRETFAGAVEKLKKLPEGQQQKWGALHTATFKHPLATLDAGIAKAFNVGPFERPGDVNTPNNTRFDDKFQQIHGATYRHLIDLANWDRALATSAPGQSGQPGSPHYDDLAPLWAKGEYFPLTYTRAKVDAVTQHRLTLQPK
ncbi:MAG: penicillin acylase family protein, partial [Planctomycetia bacterium]|nr:penicillin acylase family protein [Planctomycetia bacterium]